MGGFDNERCRLCVERRFELEIAHCSTCCSSDTGESPGIPLDDRSQYQNYVMLARVYTSQLVSKKRENFQVVVFLGGWSLSKYDAKTWESGRTPCQDVFFY